jgi:hypothetical protein
MTRLFYKEKSSVSLNDRLLSHPYFKSHWKSIPSAIKMLNRILRWNTKDQGKSSITYTKFRDLFRADHPIIISALEELDLMTVTRTWRKRLTCGRNDTGKCYDYQLTPVAHRELADTNKEYLYKLLTDKSAERKNQIAISKRGYNQKTYGDVRDHLKATIDGMSIDFEAVENAVSMMPEAKRAFVWSLLVSIIKKDYSELKPNEKDGRIWNVYTQLPAEIKRLIKIKGLSYQHTLDIRSCYPSLWAEYVYSIAPDKAVIATERAKWNALFLNAGIDPKTTIAKVIGLSRASIKEVMIKYFNGRIRGKPFVKFSQYLQAEFPSLYSAWKKTDITQTGNNIGKHFETKLMLDKSIYSRAEELGIIVGYEYDGMSFYAEDASQCQTLLEFIEQRSVALLGIKLVFVDKSNVLSIADMAEANNRSLLEEIHASWLQTCRKTFSKNATPDWKKFRNQRAKYFANLSSLLPRL